MTKIRIYPYLVGSRSAKKLSETLNGKVLKHAGSKYKDAPGDVVINWGSSNCPRFVHARVLNRDVADAQCKLRSFKRMGDAGVNIPEWCEDKNNIPDEAFPVVCRTKLKGHSGDGIVISNNREELVDAPLYVKYVKKKEEYRVHVANNEVFFVQRKARKHDIENPNWKVRNLAGGFVFVEELNCPEVIQQEALKAINALGLDFGGVDIIWNEKENQAYVLEVNTACGLEERTALKYAESLRRYVPNQG